MALPRLLFLTAGQTYDEIVGTHGDFDAWFATGFKGVAELRTCRVHKGEAPPPTFDGLDGVVISGSPSSVTQFEPFMEVLCDVVRRCAEVDMPLLGVCFGHQIMGHALGGRVEQNPAGREIGTVEVVLTRAGATDPVLGPLVPSFRAQATHVDSVVQPPPGAEVLARTAQENCAAMRVGRNLYGVQFHPEMGAALLRRYISMRARLIDQERGPGAADKVYAAVTETRTGEAIMRRFVSEVVVPHQRAAHQQRGRPARKTRTRQRTVDHYTESYARADDGVEIFYNEVGRRSPTIMMMDGLGCDQYVWKHLVEQLRPDHHVIRWNYGGHGRSPPPTGWDDGHCHRLTLEGLADDAVRVLDDAGVEFAVLFGHSMGVQAALETWRRHPTRVAALVLICGSYGRPLRTFHGNALAEAALPYVQRALNKSPRISRGVWRRLLDTELAYQFAVNVEVNGDLVKRQDFRPYFTHLARVDPRLFMKLLGNVNAHSAEPFLADVDVPTLVVAGERDTFTPAHLSGRMHHAIPGAELLVIPAGSHTAPLEIPELLSLRVEKFLKERVLSEGAAATARLRASRANGHGTPAEA